MEDTFSFERDGVRYQCECRAGMPAQGPEGAAARHVAAMWWARVGDVDYRTVAAENGDRDTAEERQALEDAIHRHVRAQIASSR